MSDRMWLVRHASTAWTGRRWLGRHDLPLTAEGEAEADRLADALADRLPARVSVVTSPTRRSRDTAARLAAALAVEVEVDDDLREIDVGRAEGLTWDELATAFPDVAALVEGGGTPDWPGGEPSDDVATRLDAAWTRLVGRSGPVVVVTHAGVVATLLERRVPAAKERWLGPAGVIALQRAGGGWGLAEVTSDDR